MRLSVWTMLAATAATLAAMPVFGQSMQQPLTARPAALAGYDNYYAADGAAKTPPAPSAAAASDSSSCGCNNGGCSNGCGNNCCGSNCCGSNCCGNSCGCNSGGCDSCGCNSCGCDNGSGSCCRGGLCSDWFADLSLNSGVTAFRGPLDLDDFGTHGNIGYEAGFNWGVPLLEGVGLQAGGNFVTSDATEEDFGHRNQYFYTTGLFHRPSCDHGVQGGMVIDYMHETWDEVHSPINLAQIRGNVSYVNGCSEFGFFFTTGVRDSTVEFNFEDSTALVSAADIYAFYYGRHLDCCRGEWKFYGGYVNQQGGIIGGSVSVALSDSFSLQTGFDYVVPRSNNGSTSDNDLPSYEAWTVGFNLVWHPCCRGRGYFCDQYRPLFDAADNTNFFFNGTTEFDGG